MLLIDTNIFLEILLGQMKQEKCEHFLATNLGNLFITDFTLHSIGVILFRNKKEEIFTKFCSDIFDTVSIVSLPKLAYRGLAEVKRTFGLEFDDAYQFKVAKEIGLDIVTLDKDFEKVKKQINIRFL